MWMPDPGDGYYLRVKGQKTIFQTSEPKKPAGIAALIYDKIEFKPKVIRRHRKGHYTLIKEKQPRGFYN